MASEVTLSNVIRNSLGSLQNTAGLVKRTQNHLSTGLKVSSAIDDAVAFFQSKVLNDRASDLGVRKDDIDQGVSSLKAATNGLEIVERLATSIKGVVLAAKSASAAERADLASQFNTLSEQLNLATNDASYQGLNLINATSSSLKVQFSSASNAFLTTSGVNVKFSIFSGFTLGAASVAASGFVYTYLMGTTGFTAGLAISGITDFTNAISNGWSMVSNYTSQFEAMVSFLESAITTIRSNAKTLGTNVSLLQTRLDFTQNYITTLKEGADKLVLADLNEEGANLVSLQTRQQLAIQALSFAGQSEQAVLSLFR